jgi:hypothetical protein
MGDRAQDVQRQLDINGADVRVDPASLEYLGDWQQEQMEAYRMFERMASAELGTGAPEQSAVLRRNKDRVSGGGLAGWLACPRTGWGGRLQGWTGTAAVAVVVSSK